MRDFAPQHLDQRRWGKARGKKMSKRASLKVAFAAAAVLAAGPALAADLIVKANPPPAPAPSMFDIAFGASIANDYNFRGISQSDRGMSVGGYFEPRFKPMQNLELYVGVAGFSTKLPTTPTGEFDFYGGARLTLGPVVFDVGGIYYYYPRERQMWTDFATVNYSDNWLGSGAYGLYAGGTLKLTAPSAWFGSGWGAYASGEAARYWLGTTNAVLGNVNLPDYTYWNIGAGVTYKAFTLDLRYHDTDATRAQCFALTGDPRGVFNGGNSRWCSSAFIAKLAVDTTLDAFK
jgi:uncharacterized protein (TIGR02001 family)